MRRLFLSFLAAAGTACAIGQTVSTFEAPALMLSGPDTAYINFLAPGTDVGFSNGLAYFPCVYDTAAGFSFWTGGFAYSNNTDTATGDFIAQYNSRPGGGAVESAQYAVFFQPYDADTIPRLRLVGSAAGKAVRSMYVTNTTYAYNVMADGDFFAGPPFGDTSATDTTHTRPDFMKLTVRGFRGGALTSDSVEFYLADFRAANSASDYIVKDWTYVSLLPLGRVDSLDFFLTSSRNNSFGNLIPAYFALDNFTTDETNTGIAGASRAANVKVYPVPATDVLHIEAQTPGAFRASLFNVAGAEVFSAEGAGGTALALPTASLPAGTYTVRITTAAGTTAVTRIQKL